MVQTARIKPKARRDRLLWPGSITRMLRGRLVIVALVLLCSAGIPFWAFDGPAVTRAMLDEQPTQPCPQFRATQHPIDIRLSPGLTEHQSWVDFPVPTHFAGYYALCFDGNAIETGGGELDFHTGVARFSIQTRRVNVHWLMRSLDVLGDARNWQLELACSPDYYCA